MRDNDDYRELLLKLCGENRHKKVTASRFRESIETTVLGVLSTFIGLVVLALILPGSVRVPVLGPIQSPLANQSLDSIPRAVCALTAIVGECLGIAGIILARSRGRLLSPLCLLGIVLCLLHMSYFVPLYILSFCLIVVLLPILYFGVRIVQKKML